MEDGTYLYAATPEYTPLDGAKFNPLGLKLRPSIHMPRVASRITLEVVSIRVERLNDISYQDILAEGIHVLPLQDEADPSSWWQSAPGENQAKDPRESFKLLWQSINGESSWELNPWLWVVEFRKLEKQGN